MVESKRYLNAFVLALLLLLIVPSMIGKGLFMDGEIYSALAHNLHIGKGSFWFPHWTGDVYTPFHQHPPMAFGLQSLYYFVFGDSLYTDRIFSLSLAIFAFLLIGAIWKEVFKKDYSNVSFLPKLFWIIIPTVFWCYMNNMLENIVTLACLLAVFVYLKAASKSIDKTWWLYLLGGAFVIIGFLSKGPVALFPIAVPGIVALVNKNYQRLFLSSLYVMLGLGLIVLCILWMSSDAQTSLQTYINNQLEPSLTGNSVVRRRTYILEHLLLELLPILILGGVYFVLRIKKWSSIPEFNRKWFYIFLLIGVSASLPIMISPKQLKFYITPSIAYYALAMAALMAHHLDKDMKQLLQRKAVKNWVLGLTASMLGIMVIWTISNDGKYRRDEVWLQDIETIGPYLEKDEKVSIAPDLGGRWMILAYLPRYYEVELYRNNTNLNKRLQLKSSPVPEGYTVKNLPTEQIVLLEK